MGKVDSAARLSHEKAGEFIKGGSKRLKKE